MSDDQEFRNSVIGASEVAVLFGVSPWLTPFQLWHEKNGTAATREFATTEYQQAGVRLENAIADWACDKWQYTRTDAPERLTGPDGVRIGGHPDAMAIDKDGERIVLEIKTVDRMAYHMWENGEPPLQYQLQAMCYAAMAGVKRAVIVALIGGNQLERHVVEVRPKLWSQIIERVNNFWASIARGDEPKPDFGKDGKLIGELYKNLEIEHCDLTDSTAAIQAAKTYARAAEIEREAKKEKAAAQAELTYLIGLDAAGANAEVKTVKVDITGFRVSSTLIAETPDREAEPGEIIKGRKSYRRLYVKENKE
jgi:putative phage-type endonuclease